jgi:hypothetical protein
MPAPISNKTQTPRLIAILTLVVALLAIPIVMSSVQNSQDIRQQASTKKPTCQEACPNTKDGSLLQNCHPPDSDGSSQNSLCNAKGRVESCGQKAYCCPKAGGKWSTEMGPCATPTPKPAACKTNEDCPKGKICIQPPMPTCPPGKMCPQVMPPKKCVPISPTPTCQEACPNTKNGNLLQNCHPADSDGSSQDSLCDAKGRVESCGQKAYCCPKTGGKWSTDMDPCTTPTPSPTIVPSGSFLKQDINQDGFVNHLDLEILLANYQLSPLTNPRADITGDGKVNALDYATLIDVYN